MSVRSKIIKTFLTSNESSIHNNASSSEKIIWSESGEKYEQIKHRLQAKTVQNSSKQIYVGGFTFSLEEALLWIMFLYFSNGLKL